MKYWNLFRRNAVVILPFVLSCISATDGLAPKDALPVVVGLILRQFFTSPTHEVQERETLAWGEGVAFGKRLPPA